MQTDQPREPQTKAGRRLFTDQEPMDMPESDGVTWEDVLAIEAEAAADALRERDEAVRLLGELADAVTALEQRAVASGGEFETWTEERWVTSIRDDARTFLRRFEGEPG